MPVQEVLSLTNHRQRVEATHADLSNSTFSDVNLAAAAFDNVNLADATLHDVNLSNLRITDANTTGMSIEGVLVSDLFAAYQASRR